VKQEIGRMIVGHDEIVHGVLTCLFVGGHCLLEGVPGIGKPSWFAPWRKHWTSTFLGSNSRLT
jgi:hypothetical protein